MASGYLLQVYRQEIIAYRFGYAKHVPLMWTTCIEVVPVPVQHS